MQQKGSFPHFPLNSLKTLSDYESVHGFLWKLGSIALSADGRLASASFPPNPFFVNSFQNIFIYLPKIQSNRLFLYCFENYEIFSQNIKNTVTIIFVHCVHPHML